MRAVGYHVTSYSHSAGVGIVYCPVYFSLMDQGALAGASADTWTGLYLAVRQRIERVRHVRSCWRTFSAEEFIQDIERSSLIQPPPSDVNELFALCDETSQLSMNMLCSKYPSFAQFLHLPVGIQCWVSLRKDEDASPWENPPTDENGWVDLCLAPTENFWT